MTTFNPFQIGEFVIEQNLQALRNSVKAAEQLEQIVEQSLQLQRQSREQSLRLIETASQQTLQNVRAFSEMTEKFWTVQQQTAKQAGERFSKQVAAFSKS